MQGVIESCHDYNWNVDTLAPTPRLHRCPPAIQPARPGGKRQATVEALLKVDVGVCAGERGKAARAHDRQHVSSVFHEKVSHKAADYERLVVAHVVRRGDEVGL